MKKGVLTCLAAFVFTTPVLFAKGSGPGNPPSVATLVQKRVNLLTTLLGLTSAQQASATTIFTNTATANTSVRSELQTARKKLQTDIEATPAATTSGPGSANTSLLQEDATAITTLENQLIYDDALDEAQFYAILSSIQQTTLKTYKSQTHGRFGLNFGPTIPGRGRD